MANPLNTLNSVINAANNSADQLTTLAKGVLCLPSILRGSVTTSASIIKGIKAGASQTIIALTSTVNSLIVGTIQNQVSLLTGAAVSVVNTIQGAIASVAAAAEISKIFVSGLKARVADIKSFISDKDNCNFAAGTLTSCIINQSLNSVTSKAIIDISKGTSSVSGITSNIAKDITSSTGVINNFINKQSAQINRASKIIDAASIF
jgi:hypothetical protein